MRMKLLAAAIGLMSIMSNAVADQSKSTIISKEFKNPAETILYWTPERLQQAKPRPYPSVDPNRIRPEVIHQDTVGKKSEEGSPPKIQLKPDMTPLFKPLLQDHYPLEMLNSGARNEQFSSSRLIPLTADLSYPYRTIGKLFFTEPGQGNYVCSATVIKPRIILTAGHCVHSGFDGANGFFTNFLFIPAFRDGTAPYQSWVGTYVNTTPEWAASNGVIPNPADYGMIELKDNVINGTATSLGNVTGWLGWQTGSLLPNHAHIIGYPCNFDSCQKMHQVTAESAVAISPNNVEYGSDMRGGSSGGPFIQNFGQPATGQTGGNNPGVNRIIGVISWGYIDATQDGQGASTLDNRFVNLLNTMCAHQPGNC